MGGRPRCPRQHPHSDGRGTSVPAMSSRHPIGSVLIPAHDESAVIGRCLHHLFDGIDTADLEVAVVCNGCHDDTAAVARATGHPVEVIELDGASKPAALRAGDRLLRTFPRLYLDAEVVLRGSTARQVLEQLARDGAVAARPPFRYDTTHSSRIVRRYYRARSQVPAVMGSIWGAGVYALTAVPPRTGWRPGDRTGRTGRTGWNGGSPGRRRRRPRLCVTCCGCAAAC